MSFESLKSRLLKLDGRFLEDEIYRIVWEEIESNELDRSAKARSIEEGAGDEGKTRSAYIKHRVRRLRDELEFHRRAQHEREKQTTTTEKPALRKSRQTCSLCGAKLGFFRKSDQLCGSCSDKILATKKML